MQRLLTWKGNSTLWTAHQLPRNTDSLHPYVNNSCSGLAMLHSLATFSADVESSWKFLQHVEVFHVHTLF